MHRGLGMANCWVNNQKKDRKAEVDTDDSEEDEDEGEDQHNNESTPKKIAKCQGAEPTNLKSSTLFTSSIDDPILMTHAKCMKENILCSWKRVESKKKVKRSNNFNDSNDNHMETNDVESETSIDSDDQGKHLGGIVCENHSVKNKNFNSKPFRLKPCILNINTFIIPLYKVI